ncbi:dystrobrevin binding protein 1b isoform X2 [Vanacampus margaritifer]
MKIHREPTSTAAAVAASVRLPCGDARRRRSGRRSCQVHTWKCKEEDRTLRSVASPTVPSATHFQLTTLPQHIGRAEADCEHAAKAPGGESSSSSSSSSSAGVGAGVGVGGQLKLKDRHKLLEEAFQQDVETYLSSGYLQIAERRGPKGSMSSMEVNVDMLEQMDLMDMSDHEALDVFLHSGGEDNSAASPVAGPESLSAEISLAVPTPAELRHKLSSGPRHGEHQQDGEEEEDEQEEEGARRTVRRRRRKRAPPPVLTPDPQGGTPQV